MTALYTENLFKKYSLLASKDDYDEIIIPEYTYTREDGAIRKYQVGIYSLKEIDDDLLAQHDENCNSLLMYIYNIEGNATYYYKGSKYHYDGHVDESYGLTRTHIHTFIKDCFNVEEFYSIKIVNGDSKLLVLQFIYTGGLGCEYCLTPECKCKNMILLEAKA